MPASDDQVIIAKDEHLMGRLLVLGTVIGFPIIFVLYFLVATIGEAHGPGALFVAAWGALIGGTFVGAGIVLAPKMAELDEAGRLEQHLATSTSPPDGQANRADDRRSVRRRDQFRPAEG